MGRAVVSATPIPGGTDMIEDVILVDSEDNEVGSMEKLQAHLRGKLHRAFSVFILNTKNDQMLIQKRAKGKYHSGGLWSNTCCSHPRPGESLESAVSRRLKEEMGMECDTREIFSKTYKAILDNNIIENEFDHIFIGTFEGLPDINPEEAEDWKWISIEELLKSLRKEPHVYTVWFGLLLKDVLSLFKNKNSK